ncbi:hypothetical protein Ct61P_12173 [Colletotrichum tofieldiae]|nr:hypothetical protein Ct61P_12173 [Colletotrichum tofieldiae]
MCMKVFALHRCLAPSNGGCDGYYAEYVEDQSCNRMMHGGLPQLDCRTVWAGFEEEHNRQIAYIQGQAELERNGEFSDRVQALVADLTRKAELGHTEFMLRVYHELWDAAQLLVAGLSNKTDVAWDGIEAALWTHFGVDGMTLAPVRAMVASLREVRRELLGHVRTNVKEMAVALVGPNESWDVDLEIGGILTRNGGGNGRWLSRPRGRGRGRRSSGRRSTIATRLTVWPSFRCSD